MEARQILKYAVDLARPMSDESGFHPNLMVPKFVFLTKGIGRDFHKLNSFELALRSAGIEKFNLVSVSSILPPGCEIISREEGLKKLTPGQIAFVVLAKHDSDILDEKIAASVGMAVPKNRENYGYLSEHHCEGQDEKAAGEYAEDLAAHMLASTLGITGFKTDTAWDEKKEIYKMDGRIVSTQNLTQTATVEKDEEWTTVIVAAVLIL